MATITALLQVPTGSLTVRELGCNVALYGHTHIPKLDYDGKLYIINPGSPSCPRGGAPRTFAILTAECGSLNAKMMQL